MQSLRHRLPAGLACVLLLLSLTGCMRFKVSTTIVNDDDIRLSLDFGVLKSAAQAAGTTDVCGNNDAVKDLNSHGGRSSIASYDDGTYLGCRINATTSLAAMRMAGSSGWTITRDGRTYKFTMKPSGLNDTPADSGQLTAGAIDQFLVSVTFPGKVLSHSGDSTVDGHTVSWSSASDIDQTLVATGRDSGGLPWWVWLILGAAVLGLVGAALAAVLARRRARARGRVHEAEQQWAAGQSAALWNAQQWNGQPSNAPQWNTERANPSGWTPAGAPDQAFPPGATPPGVPCAGQYQPPTPDWEPSTGWQQPASPQGPSPWQGPGTEGQMPYAPAPYPQPGPTGWSSPAGGSTPYPQTPQGSGAHVWQPPAHPDPYPHPGQYVPPNQQETSPGQSPDAPNPWQRPE